VRALLAEAVAEAFTAKHKIRARALNLEARTLQHVPTERTAHDQRKIPAPDDARLLPFQHYELDPARPPRSIVNQVKTQGRVSLTEGRPFIHDRSQAARLRVHHDDRTFARAERLSCRAFQRAVEFRLNDGCACLRAALALLIPALKVDRQGGDA
jgi:hypothetical protein